MGEARPIAVEQFNQMYKCYATDVLRMAYYYLKDRQRAEDVTQDVFVKLYRLGGGIEPGKEKAWLMRVTVNACRDKFRSAWLRRVTLGSPVLDIMPGQKNEIDSFIESETLAKAIGQLNPKYIEVILLFYFQGFGISEIAAILNTSEGTVSSRLSRAREKLKGLLKEE